MEELFKVIDLDIKDKVDNLKSEAHSSVKSTKYFPIYEIEGKQMIFKPLSKTKPLTTPFFAYSEVYWSYIINKYFDARAPRYYLATCNGMDKEQPKYFNKGVLVESLTPNGEKLINLYDYFVSNPEEIVDINDYVNYCMKNYDYTKILSSEFIRNNKDIGRGLAYQILLSILRQDQNFHYENINFIYQDETILLEPPIDFEFSTPFLYPDKEEGYKSEKEKYFHGLEIEYEDDEMTKFFKKMGMYPKGIIKSNIVKIIKMYPEVVMKFIDNLTILIEDLPSITISDPNNYIGALNSDYWEVGHAFYKDDDMEKYEKLKEKIRLEEVDKDKIFNRISNDVLENSKKLRSLLKKYLVCHFNGIDNLENITLKEILETLKINEEQDIENKKYPSLKAKKI